MRFFLIVVALSFTVTKMHAQTSFYRFSLDSLGARSTISFSDFSGKRILIVNTASYDSLAGQFNELIQLKKLFKDSLIILAIPSNSFGTEPAADSVIAKFYIQDAAQRIVVASKTLVIGSNKHALYQWLTTAALNTVLDSEVKGSYQKYLLNRHGRLIGVFGPLVRPMDMNLINAIQKGFQ